MKWCGGVANKVGDRGFSLIELIVVVAIVAVLASVAIPAYKSYVLKSRLNSLSVVTNSLIDRAIKFQAAKGRFPNATELGYASTPNSTTVENVTQFGPYFADVYFIIQDWSSGWGKPANCGAVGTIEVGMGAASLSAFGFDSSVVNWGARCNFWHTNGIIKKFCYYGYGDGGNPFGSKTDNIMPTGLWVNAAGSNGQWWANTVTGTLHNADLTASTCP